MSGNGGSHLRVVPRSPWVPTMANQAVMEWTDGCRGRHSRYVRIDEVATGGDMQAVTCVDRSGKSVGVA